MPLLRQRHVQEGLEDGLPEPDVAGLMVVAFMPVLAHVVSRQAERQLQYFDGRIVFQGSGHPRRKNRKQVGGRDHLPDAQQRGDLDLHLALDAALFQNFVQPGMHGGRGVHGNILFSQEVMHGKAVSKARMVAPGDAGVLLGHQALLVDARLQFCGVADRHVHFARLQLLACVRPQFDGLYAQARRALIQQRDQFGQQGHLRHVGQAQTKGPGRCAGVEWSICADWGQQFQCLFYLGQQAFHARRSLHAGRRAHEQRVAEVLAQMVQADADGRLAQADVLHRARDAAAAVDFLQDQQVGNV